MDSYNEIELKKIVKMNFQDLVDKNNEGLATEDALNLIGKLLVLDPVIDE